MASLLLPYPSFCNFYRTPPSFLLLLALFSSLPLVPTLAGQQYLKSCSSALHYDGLTICLFGLWVWGALRMAVDILCGLDDLRNKVGLEGLVREGEFSDEAIDPANAPSQLGVVAVFDFVVGSE